VAELFSPPYRYLPARFTYHSNDLTTPNPKINNININMLEKPDRIDNSKTKGIINPNTTQHQ